MKNFENLINQYNARLEEARKFAASSKKKDQRVLEIEVDPSTVEGLITLNANNNRSYLVGGKNNYGYNSIDVVEAEIAFAKQLSAGVSFLLSAPNVGMMDPIASRLAEETIFFFGFCRNWKKAHRGHDAPVSGVMHSLAFDLLPFTKLTPNLVGEARKEKIVEIYKQARKLAKKIPEIDGLYVGGIDYLAIPFINDHGFRDHCSLTKAFRSGANGIRLIDALLKNHPEDLEKVYNWCRWKVNLPMKANLDGLTSPAEIETKVSVYDGNDSLGDEGRAVIKRFLTKNFYKSAYGDSFSKWFLDTQVDIEAEPGDCQSQDRTEEEEEENLYNHIHPIADVFREADMLREAADAVGICEYHERDDGSDPYELAKTTAMRIGRIAVIWRKIRAHMEVICAKALSRHPEVKISDEDREQMWLTMLAINDPLMYDQYKESKKVEEYLFSRGEITFEILVDHLDQIEWSGDGTPELRRTMYRYNELKGNPDLLEVMKKQFALLKESEYYFFYTPKKAYEAAQIAYNDHQAVGTRAGEDDLCIKYEAERWADAHYFSEREELWTPDREGWKEHIDEIVEELESGAMTPREFTLATIGEKYPEYVVEAIKASFDTMDELGEDPSLTPWEAFEPAYGYAPDCEARDRKLLGAIYEVMNLESKYEEYLDSLVDTETEQALLAEAIAEENEAIRRRNEERDALEALFNKTSEIVTEEMDLQDEIPF